MKQRLNLPGSAIFRDPTANNGDTTFTPSSDRHVYAISSSFDTKNDVGDRLRSTFRCTATRGEADGWSVTQLDIHNGGYMAP